MTGKSEAVFSQFSQPFHEAGIHTLALGKPGIDFAGPTDQPFQVHFYDRDLYLQLQWKDLIQNLDEAVRFAKTLPNVDPEKIYILGHSEGTQVAVDYAQKHSSVKGIILLGYYAVSMSRIIDFQDFIRPIQYFVEPSVDANHDGYITREEASQWPEFAVATQWQWPQGQERVSIQELQNYMRSRPDLKANYNQMQNLPIWKAVWNRSPIYHEMASLKQDV